MRTFRKHNLYLIVSLLFFVTFSGNVSAKDSYVFVIGRDPETTHRGMWMKKVFDEAFNKVGINYTIKYMPLKRASLSTDRELVDGDIYRVKDYNDKHTNLYRVPEPSFVGRISAFSRDKSIKIENKWQSFKDSDFVITYQRGNKTMKENLEAVVDPQKLEATNSVAIGLRLLNKKRCDIFVAVDDEVRTVLQKDEFKNIEIYTAESLVITPVHAFFLHKHKELADKVAGVLRDMKKEGLVEKYRVETNQALAGK